MWNLLNVTMSLCHHVIFFMSAQENGIENYSGTWYWMHDFNEETEGNRFEQEIFDQYGESTTKKDDGSIEHNMTWYQWVTGSRNGNNMQEVVDTLNLTRKNALQGKPQLILAHTVMGKGVDFMENNHKWHGTPPNDEQAANALSQLTETLGDY